MTYEKSQKKKSDFTTDDLITNASTLDYVKEGVNKKTSWSNLLDKIGDVYGASLRIFDTESELVASDIRIGEHAIVVENGYTLYSIGNLAASTGDVTLASGYVATFRDRHQTEYDDYTELRGLKSSAIPDGTVIKITDDGIAGDFVAKTGANTDNGGTIIQAGDDVNRYYERVPDDFVNLEWFEPTGSGDESSKVIAAHSVNGRLLIPSGVTVHFKELEVNDNDHLIIRGTIKLPNSSSEWDRIITNTDRVNGNQNVTIDLTGGVMDGNAENQGSVVQHSMYFVNCSGFDIFGGKWGNNRAAEITPSNHPEGPFNQGVPYGNISFTNPSIGCVVFIGGRENKARDFRLVNFQQEGVVMRWNEGSIIDNFQAIAGPETEDPYYTSVDWGSRAGSQTVSIGDHVLVQNGHTFGGVKQQPDLIYEALVAGTYDLGAEDYTDAARWTLVERDISNDFGYTAARCGGAKSQANIISNGYAAFCRASSFSNDSEISGMSNLISYHNSYQVGINFGHANTPASRGFATGLIAINPGWKGGLAGNSYGINIVSASNLVTVSDFYVCGAGRNSVNVSDSADLVTLSNGVTEFSAAGGIKASSANVKCINVSSKYNVGDDFEAAGTAVISLTDCEDSSNRNITNERVILTARNEQPTQSLHGETGHFVRSFRNDFAVSSGVALFTVNITNTVGADGMLVTCTYLERNTGSASAGNQYAAKATFQVIGSGTSRTVSQLDAPFSQNRQFRASWDVAGILSVFLQDNVPNDVAASTNQNSLYVEVQNGGAQNFTIAIG